MITRPNGRSGGAAGSRLGRLTDAFTLEIVKDKLVAAADEMGVVLARTSMSPIVYEVLDFACGLTDENGQVVAQTNGLTLFTGTFGPQVESTIEKYGLAGMRPGDVFITNIPYRGGTHTCDVCLVRPVFAGGEVVAFAVSITHWIEIGGKVPGSIGPDATEIFQEGLQLPCLRLYEAGTLSTSIVDLIRANVRLPELASGDLNAGLAAVRIGEVRVAEACERYGVGAVRTAFSAILDHGERIARAELARIPDGVYWAEDAIDGDGLSEDDLPVRVEVTVEGGAMSIDFTGCAPAAKGPVNCTTGALHSACKTVIRAITSPGARSNDGFFRPVTITIPPGTVFSAQSPSPTGWYYEASAFATELVWRALAPVVPERLGAGSYASLSVSYIVGTDGRDGSLFVHAEPNVGGWGADRDADGENALIATTDGDTYNYPVEVVETRFPLRVERYALVADPGGGPGRNRGGLGCVREYRVLAEAEAVSAYGSMGGWRRRPWGLAGGEPGSNNVLEYRRGDEVLLRHGRVPRIELEAGDVVTVLTAGGGGFGSPLEREPHRVLSDVLDGYVTREHALADYGVVIGDDLELDPAATERERSRR